MYDIILKNGLVLDGRGSAPFRADVALFCGCVAYISSSSSLSRGRIVVDCSGKYVAPGFIDSHAHSELLVLKDRTLRSRIGQGITTDISGNCGMGVFPFFSENQKEYVRDVLGEYGEWEWDTFSSYRAYAEKKGIGNNQVLLTAHSALRSAVMGGDTMREARDEEIEAMCSLLSHELSSGSAGFSTGLSYAPAVFSTKKELTELARVAGRMGRVFAIHHRSEGRDCLRSLEEALDIALEASVRTEISHLKTIGKDGGDDAGKLLSLIEEYRGKGLDVAFDQYPYNYGSTSLFSLLPPRILSYSRLEQRMALSLESERKEIRKEIMEGDGWDSIYPLVGPENIHIVHLSSTHRFDSMSLAETAASLGVLDPLDALFDILSSETGSAIMTDVTESRETMERIMASPLMAFGSDSLYSSPSPHPRSFHAAPRFLGTFCRDRGILTLEEGVRRMTGETARRFGLRDRGEIREGAAADITVFDYSRIGEGEGDGNNGIECVIVNGRLAKKGDTYYSDAPGRVIRL